MPTTCRPPCSDANAPSPPRSRPGRRRSLTNARTTLGAGTAYLGDLEGGLAILHEALDGAGENAYMVVRAYANLADTLGLMGRHEEAVEAATKGMAFAERVGLARTAGTFVTVNLLESLLSLGRWEEADAALAPELRAGLAGVFEAGMYEVRARMRALQGRYEEAADRPRARAAADRRPSGQHPVLPADGVRARRGRPREPRFEAARRPDRLGAANPIARAGTPATAGR